MKYYKIKIDETSKGMREGADVGYSIFNQREEFFKTIEEVKSYLKEYYGGHKRVKMYCDNKDGKAKQTGWIYCFNNKDISHNSEWWRQQDWISISEIEEKEVLL